MSKDPYLCWYRPRHDAMNWHRGTIRAWGSDNDGDLPIPVAIVEDASLHDLHSVHVERVSLAKECPRTLRHAGSDR